MEDIFSTQSDRKPQEVSTHSGNLKIVKASTASDLRGHPTADERRAIDPTERDNPRLRDSETPAVRARRSAPRKATAARSACYPWCHRSNISHLDRGKLPSEPASDEESFCEKNPVMFLPRLHGRNTCSSTTGRVQRRTVRDITGCPESSPGREGGPSACESSLGTALAVLPSSHPPKNTQQKRGLHF